MLRLLLLVSLAVSCGALYKDSHVQEVPTVVIRSYSTLNRFGHSSGGVLMVPYHERDRRPFQVCPVTTGALCGLDYPSQKSCVAVTPDCLCYNWAYAGMSNASVLTAAYSGTTTGCVDVRVQTAGEVELLWDLTAGTSPVLPSAIAASWIGTITPSVLRLICPKLPYTPAGCFIKHKLRFELLPDYDNIRVVGQSDPWYLTMAVMIGVGLATGCLIRLIMGPRHTSKHKKE